MATVGAANVVCAAAEPVAAERVLFTNGREFWPANDDYDNDGVGDYLTRVATGGAFGITMRLVSGNTGATLRQFDPPPTSYVGWVFTRAASLPDSDGDGKREFLLGDPTNVWAVKSSASGGRADQLPQVFTFSSLPFGQHVTVSDRSVVLASGDESKLLFANPRTGAVQARVSNVGPVGQTVGYLGISVATLGDLTGDGIADFASSGSVVPHGNNPSGSVFLISGAISTTAGTYTPLSSMPSGTVLAELTGSPSMGGGAAGQWTNTTVNLGDPRPGNSVTESLIVTGSPYGNLETGALAAHVVSRQSNGSLSTQTVATYLPTAKWHYGADLINLGDLTGDGVADLAVLNEGFGVESGGQRGRIEIIDGAALLDGFNPTTDVIQTIVGRTNAFFYGSMQPLGDYDGDGRIEFAATVLYNGYEGRYGYAQQVYEVVPEPSPAWLALAAVAARRVRRRLGK